MSDPHSKPTRSEDSESLKESLAKAFETFQQQCAVLESTHRDLRRQLEAAELSLEEKNRELAGRIREVESMRETLEGVIGSISDAVLLADRNGEIRLSNVAADQWIARFPGIGRSLKDVPELSRFLKADRPVLDTEVEIRFPEERRTYLISAVPMTDDHRSSQCIVLSIKDMTDLRRLQQSLDRENRLAALGRVAASVAHEIRNPLAAIEGFARLLERDLAEQPNLSRLASKVIYGARQLNSVVGNLLTYTRDYPVSTEECRIDELIEEALEFCIPIAVDRKIAVDFEKKSADCRAKVTPIPFKQVITNLVLNAIDACTQRKDGHITIRTQRRGRHVQVVVSDNGGGIPTENKARIFEPFFTQKEGGVGLGLALCQRIIDAHGGEIAECGEEGVGARFEIRLPAETGVNDPKN